MFGPNVYYDPDKFGLKAVGEIEFSSGSYEFDLFVVWQNADGKFFYATDSGCSCPSPFEDTGVTDLTEATPQEIQAAAEARIIENSKYSWQARYIESAKAQLVELMAKLVK